MSNSTIPQIPQGALKDGDPKWLNLILRMLYSQVEETQRVAREALEKAKVAPTVEQLAAVRDVVVNRGEIPSVRQIADVIRLTSTVTITENNKLQFKLEATGPDDADFAGCQIFVARPDAESTADFEEPLAADMRPVDIGWFLGVPNEPFEAVVEVDAPNLDYLQLTNDYKVLYHVYAVSRSLSGFNEPVILTQITPPSPANHSPYVSHVINFSQYYQTILDGDALLGDITFVGTPTVSTRGGKLSISVQYLPPVITTPGGGIPGTFLGVDAWVADKDRSPYQVGSFVYMGTWGAGDSTEYGVFTCECEPPADLPQKLVLQLASFSSKTKRYPKTLTWNTDTPPLPTGVPTGWGVVLDVPADVFDFAPPTLAVATPEVRRVGGATEFQLTYTLTGSVLDSDTYDSTEISIVNVDDVNQQWAQVGRHEKGQDATFLSPWLGISVGENLTLDVTGTTKRTEGRGFADTNTVRVTVTGLLPEELFPDVLEAGVTVTVVSNRTDPDGNQYSEVQVTYSTVENARIYRAYIYPGSVAPAAPRLWQFGGYAVDGEPVKFWMKRESGNQPYVLHLTAGVESFESRPKDSAWVKTFTVPKFAKAQKPTAVTFVKEDVTSGGQPKYRFKCTYTPPSDPNFWFLKFYRIKCDASFVPLAGEIYTQQAFFYIDPKNPTANVVGYSEEYDYPGTYEFYIYKGLPVNSLDEETTNADISGAEFTFNITLENNAGLDLRKANPDYIPPEWVIGANSMVVARPDTLSANSNFENGTLDGWSADLGYFSYDATNGIGGTGCVKRVGSGATGAAEGFRNLYIFPCKVGDRFTCGGRAKVAGTTNGTAYVRLTILNSNKSVELQYLTATTFTASTSYNGTPDTVEVTNSAASYARLEVIVTGHTTGTWYFDDLSCTKVPADGTIPSGALDPSTIGPGGVIENGVLQFLKPDFGNLDFESGAAGWTLQDNASIGAFGIGGSKGLRVGPSATYPLGAQSASVISGTVIRLRSRAYRETGALAGIQIAFADSTGTLTHFYNASVTSSSWGTVDVTSAPAPSTAVAARIALFAEPYGGTAFAYFDAVEVEIVTPQNAVTGTAPAALALSVTPYSANDQGDEMYDLVVTWTAQDETAQQAEIEFEQVFITDTTKPKTLGRITPKAAKWTSIRFKKPSVATNFDLKCYWVTKDGTRGSAPFATLAGVAPAHTAGTIPATQLKLASADLIVNADGTMGINAANWLRGLDLDPNQFTYVSGKYLIDALGVNYLVAGTALFTGTVVFRQAGTGGEVEISSTGVKLTSGSGGVNVTSTGVSISSGGAVTITGSGVNTVIDGGGVTADYIGCGVLLQGSDADFSGTVTIGTLNLGGSVVSAVTLQYKDWAGNNVSNTVLMV